MIYHVPSWTGLLLTVRFGWLRGDFKMSQRTALFHHLESPGTKAYSLPEAASMLRGVGFTDVKVWTEFAVGDLMTLKLGEKYQGAIYRLIRALYPRWLVKLLGRRWGLNLLMTARKPER